MEHVCWLKMSFSPAGGANGLSQILLVDLSGHFEAGEREGNDVLGEIFGERGLGVTLGK